MAKCSYCHQEKEPALSFVDRHLCPDCLKKLCDYLFRLHFGMSPDRKPVTRRDN